jgi:hypothetical protein
MKLCVTNFFQGSAIIWMDEHKKVGLWLKMGKIKVNSICEGKLDIKWKKASKTIGELTKLKQWMNLRKLDKRWITIKFHRSIENG